MFKISMNVCLDNIFWTTEPYITKLGMMVVIISQCHANKTTGTKSQGSCNQNITVSIFKTSDPFTAKLCLMIRWECLVKNCFAVFKVNITAKAQNSNECLSGWYFLNYLTFCSQTWCGDASSRTSVFQNSCFATLKFKVTVRSPMPD